MQGYTFTQTVSQVRALLAERLNDPSMTFFSSEELTFYLQEALETFNTHARYFRTFSSLSVAANTQFTSLQLASSLDETNAPFIPLDNYQFSGQQVLKSLLLHLMESQSTSTIPTRTGHISDSQLISCLNQACDRFAQESQSIIYRTATTSTVAGVRRVTLPADVHDVQRIELTTIDANAPIYIVQRVTKDELDKLLPSLNTQVGRPRYFTVSNTPARNLDLYPTPNDTYPLGIYSVNNLTHLTPYTTGLFTADETLTYPRQWWPAVKFLALHLIYSFDGPLKHPQLSDYCRQRYEQYVLLSRSWHPIEHAYHNGALLDVCGVEELDFLDPRWRNPTNSTSPVKKLALLGQNLVFLRRKNGATPITLTFDLIPLAPSLTANDQMFPVGEDYLSYVLDYAQHIATIKMGGTEFTTTLPLYQNFLRGCARVNDKLHLGALRKVMNSEVAVGQKPRRTDGREGLVPITTSQEQDSPQYAPQ